MTIAIKDAVERTFAKKNDGGAYLEKLADEHPAVFCGLVAKCIPQAIAMNVDIKHTFNLGLEMQKADRALARLNSPGTPITIEHEPGTPEHDTVTPDTVTGVPGDREPGEV